jgi:phosphatidylserine decarboxylase
MATVWHGIVNPPRTSAVREWRYDGQQFELKKGDEMGRFLLGSTVVMLFPKDTLTFNSQWQLALPVRMGEVMGL